jgi:hypothetical protein
MLDRLARWLVDLLEITLHSCIVYCGFDANSSPLPMEAAPRGRVSFRTTIESHTLPLALALVGVLAFPSVSFAVVLSTGFAGPSLDPSMIEAGSPGTSYTVGKGTLVLSQAAGRGNGQISISAISPVTGDFIMSVTASAANLGRADLGIELGTTDWTHSLADVFINNLGHSVNGNIFQPAFNGAFRPNTTNTMTLTITRVGDQISDIFDNGSGPIVLNSGLDASLSGPVTISLFLLEAAGDTGAHQGTFSDFDVRPFPNDNASAENLAEPGTVAVLGFSMFVLFGLTTIRRDNIVAK